MQPRRWCQGGSIPRSAPDLIRMLAFVAHYTRADGRAPQLGDADDGRFLPVRDYGLRDQSSHLHLFRQAGRVYQPSTRSAAYPDGGFYIMRAGNSTPPCAAGMLGFTAAGAMLTTICWHSSSRGRRHR